MAPDGADKASYVPSDVMVARSWTKLSGDRADAGELVEDPLQGRDVGVSAGEDAVGDVTRDPTDRHRARDGKQLQDVQHRQQTSRRPDAAGGAAV